MAEEIVGNNVFIYMGGVVPRHITHAVIHPSVKVVPSDPFRGHFCLVSIIFHDDVEKIEEFAFSDCKLLGGRIKLLGVKEIGVCAFYSCIALTDVEFGDELETIGTEAFYSCNSLRSVKMPSVRTIQNWAFGFCDQLTEVEFGSDLETIGCDSFYKCPNLRRIAIPLKNNIFPLHLREEKYNQFDQCGKLMTVDLVGAEGIHKTIASLLLESWRDEVRADIDRINQELPYILPSDKTNAIRLWIRSVVDRLDHYKAEHNILLKEHMTQLELAIWKAKLDKKEVDSALKVQPKRAKIDAKSIRKEKRITSGANIIIKNVLPFLKLG